MRSSTIPRVVVGVDGSDSARLALQWALCEASRCNGLLEVLYAWEPPLVVTPVGIPGSPWDLTEYRKNAKQLACALADEACAHVAGAGPRPLPADMICARAVEGAPARALLEAAAGADLLVVGSRGMGGFASLLLGSVSQQCVRHAPCPVAVVPPHWSPSPRHGVVVAGVDSTGSRSALAWAAREARQRGSRLRVIHAWQLPMPASPNTARIAEYDESVLEAAAVATADALRREIVEPILDEEHVEVSVLCGPTALSLLDAAEAADLLVVGSRGRGGFTSLLLGSVSQECAEHSSCPVVVVRSTHDS